MKPTYIIHSTTLAAMLAGIVACGGESRPAAPLDERIPEAGRDAADAARDAGARVSAAIEIADVKLALSMDAAIDASHIDVEADHTSGTVTLTGWVRTSDERTRAASVAAREAPEYRIDNQLDVRGA